jgi:SNF2 family DNA or RNA helicase
MNKEYKVEVKSWMMKPSSPDFDFMEKWNNDIPMPLKIMYGVKVAETRGMVKMKLHGDIKQRVTQICMCCGRPITNKISQFFGVGPICGNHNYVNPFDTEEELNEAVKLYREKLVNTTWEGWIVKSAILYIDDDSDIYTKLNEMPIVEETSTKEVSNQINSTSNVEKSADILARIDKPTRCTDDYSVYLSFKYNPSIIQAVKDLPSRFWNSDNKEWEIGYSELASLQNTLSSYTFKVEGEDKVRKSSTSIPSEFTYTTTPYKYQEEAVEYGLSHNRWLLGDMQGLGKTKEIIDLAVIRKISDGFKHCLIICGVNSLKWNWLEEISKHSQETGWILGMKQTRSGKWAIGTNSDKINDLNKIGHDAEMDSHYFIITNIESLRNSDIVAKLKELCDNDIINMVAIDEIHRARNLRTQQGKGMLQLQPTCRIGMTGTPLMNTPLDLYAILKWLGFQSYGYSSFKNHFCITDSWGNVIAYKNIDQLEGQLDNIMLRRTKDQVLDLPEKTYINEYVELTDEQKDLYNQAINDMLNDPEIEDDLSLDNQLALKIRLRQISGGIAPFNFINKNPKFDRIEQIVEEAIYNNTKVIIFSNWVSAINPIVERLAKYNPLVITGETKDSDRQAIVNRFQNDDTVKVIAGTTGAMGTGLNLYNASTIIFLDHPWTRAEYDQAVDRAHRIGQTKNVTVFNLIGKNTYDEDVWDIVNGKKDISDRILEKKDLLKYKLD